MFFKSDREKTSGHFILWENIVTAPFIKVKNDLAISRLVRGLGVWLALGKSSDQQKKIRPDRNLLFGLSVFAVLVSGKENFSIPPLPLTKSKKNFFVYQFLENECFQSFLPSPAAR